MFFRFILIVFIITYILYLLGRWWIRRKLRNIQDEFNGQQEMRKSRDKKEGDVIVERKEKKKKKFSESDGEYVDFEEIE